VFDSSTSAFAIGACESESMTRPVSFTPVGGDGERGQQERERSHRGETRGPRHGAVAAAGAGSCTVTTAKR
jgi:hypothetical protein